MRNRTQQLRVLSSLMLVLFQAVPAGADMLDGGEIRFNGFVTDEAPKWTWQVATRGQTWSVDTADARYVNGQLVFDLKEKGALPFLEGHLDEVAERGGQGLTPVVTFSSDGQPFSVAGGGSTAAPVFRATVPVEDVNSGHVAGQLSFTLSQGMALSAGEQTSGGRLPSGMLLVSAEDGRPDGIPQSLMNRLSALLQMNRGFGQGMSSVSQGNTADRRVLTDGRMTNLAAAYASSVSDFTLSLPAQDTPSQWRARLNVTVTVQ